MSLTPLPLPLVGRPADPAPGGARAPLEVCLGGGRHLLHVADAGLACCAVEVAAAVARSTPPPAGAVEPGEPVHVLLVSGTVTDTLLPGVLDAYAALPEPRRVIAYGACVTSGGTYRDSYCVTKGIDQFLPVDVYVPGCPPRPEALADGLAKLATLLGEPAP